MMDTTYTGAVVPGISIENLLNQRDAIMERVKAAITTLLEAKDIYAAAGLGGSFERVLTGPDTRYGTTDLLAGDELERIRNRLDSAAWSMLMDQSGLMTFMDSAARAKLREQIDKTSATHHRRYGEETPSMPPLTMSNIEATFKSLYASRGDMFDRGVIECFKRLSWDYKTNLPFKFGKRIHARIRSYGHFSFDHTNRIEDLQRCFCVLDGKPEEDHRNGLYSRLSKYHSQSTGTHDDTYMRFRWFKNGNCQITFLRADLVERMNLIVAKHFPGALAYDRHSC